MGTRTKRKRKATAQKRAAGAAAIAKPAETAAVIAARGMQSEPAGERQAASAPGAPAGITPAERRRMVAEAAYFRAERRGFAAGGELEDWLQAETEIDQLAQSGRSRAKRGGKAV